MKKAILLAGMLALALSARAQSTGALSGYCNKGADQAQTQGLTSANYQQGIVPSCTITVYLHGTTTLATIFSDGIQTPLANPFTATTSGQWTFYAALNNAFDVIGSGPPSGIPPNVYPAPVDLCIDCFASAQVTTPVGGPALETNGVANADQTYLDLDNGSGVIVTNTSGGHVNFAVNPSTLNPPQYQTAAANKTANSRTTSVTLASVNAGSRLIAFADSNTYNCLSASGQPYYPTITDTQGNIWTVDASAFSSYIGGNSGANMIVADATISASGSITITATQPNTGGTCATAFLTVAEYASVVGVDVASVQACSLGCSGALAPSATAVAQNNELAVVLSETASGTGATAVPGSLAFSDASQTWAYIWQFGALNVGLATTSTLSNFSQNFPGAAIILLKSSLTFGTMTNPMYAAGQMIEGGTNGSPTALPPGSNGQVLQMTSGAPAWQTAIASGSAYAFPSYGSGASNSVSPSNITTDSTGNNLTVPGAIHGPATVNLVGAGDSRMAGSNVSTGQDLLTQISLQPQFAGNYVGLHNGAVGGARCNTTGNNMTASYAANVQPYKPNGTTVKTSYLFIEEGINDITDGVSLSSLESCWQSYLNQAVADGFTPIPLTVYYMYGASVAEEVERQQFNQWLLSLPYHVENFDKYFPAVSYSNLYGLCATVGPPCSVGNQASVTATSTSAGVTTFTAANSFSASQVVYLGNFAHSACLNNQYVTVLSTGLSGTQFEATTNCLASQPTDTGLAELVTANGEHLWANGIILAAQAVNADWGLNSAQTTRGPAQVADTVTPVSGSYYINAPQGIQGNGPLAFTGYLPSYGLPGWGGVESGGAGMYLDAIGTNSSTMGTTHLRQMTSGAGTVQNVLDSDTSGNVSLAGGSTVVYRCTVAGTLPIGAMTTDSTKCGASGATDTGLRLK